MAILYTQNDPFTAAEDYDDMADKPLINNKQLNNCTSQELNIVWHGTQDQYKALTERNNECVYVIQDDNTQPIVLDDTDEPFNMYQKKQDFTLKTYNKFVVNSINELVRNVGDIDNFEIAPHNDATEGVSSMIGSIGNENDLTTEITHSMVEALNDCHPGDRDSLKTDIRTNAVAAINEVNYNVGDTATLITTTKQSCVKAINEVDATIGDTTKLTTVAKKTIVSAIDQLDGDIGALTSLTTTAKTSIKDAINEHDKQIGNLANLKTPKKGNLVEAINCVVPPPASPKGVFTLSSNCQLVNYTITYISQDLVFITLEIKFKTAGRYDAADAMIKSHNIDGRKIQAKEILWGTSKNMMSNRGIAGVSRVVQEEMDCYPDFIIFNSDGTGSTLNNYTKWDKSAGRKDGVPAGSISRFAGMVLLEPIN